MSDLLKWVGISIFAIVVVLLVKNVSGYDLSKLQALVNSFGGLFR